MKLVDVYTVLPDATDILWALLTERTPEMNISHRHMPTLAEHQAFIASKPYQAWYVIDAGEERYIGAAYLTRQREIGIGILKRYRGMGYGRLATLMLMERHRGGRFLANIAPRNFSSQAMFQDLGFNLLQHTYELQR